MSAVDMLRHKQLQYDQKISNAEAKIRNLENDYDSLVLFKHQVQKSQDEAGSLNSAKSGILDRVADVKANNLVAQKYYKSMKDILSSIGIKLMPMAFSAMVARIDAQLRSYQKKVAEYERDIDDYNRRIRDLDNQIAMLQAAEAAVKGLDI